MAKRNAILPPTHEKSLEVYFREINRFSLLTREQEADLARRIRAGDQDALKTLVKVGRRAARLVRPSSGDAESAAQRPPSCLCPSERSLTNRRRP